MPLSVPHSGKKSFSPHIIPKTKGLEESLGLLTHWGKSCETVSNCKGTLLHLFTESLGLLTHWGKSCEIVSNCKGTLLHLFTGA